MHVALLRGINVGGANVIAMSELRALFEELGFAGVRTLQQSGNVVFDAGWTKSTAIEARIEKALAARHGIETDCFVRSAAQWTKLVAANPFTREARDDPSHLLALVTKRPPTAARVAALQAAIRGPEQARGAGGGVFIHYGAGMARSKLTSNVIDRALGSRGTGRNWNTVMKLAALLEG
jgi:uncharacterized protein (DUF1697 family)